MIHGIKAKRIGLFLVALMMGGALSSQTEVSNGYFTGSAFWDVFAADLGGFGGAFAAVGLNFLVGAMLGADGAYTQEDHMIASSMTALSALPHFLSGSPDALAASAAQAGLWGLEQAAGYGLGTFSYPANLLYWAKIDMTMHSAYDAYASMRLRSTAWDNSSFKRYGFLELMGAPFGPEFATPQTLLAIGGGLASVLLYQLVDAPEPWKTSPFSTGRTFLGDIEVSPIAFGFASIVANLVSGAYTGAGEEAVFRGFFREELTSWVGPGWATVIDTGAFLLMHLFTDMARGMKWESIAVHLAFVAAGNLLFDWAYDAGGLRLAASAHAWWDIAAFTASSLLYRGVASR